jgi:cytochrome c oxidase subunit 2
MLVGATVVFAVVMVLVLVAVLRRHAGRAPGGSDRRAKALVLTGGLVAPVVVLSVLFAFTIRTLPATSAPKQGSTALTVDVIGHQWFWEVRYPGTAAVTANEIHIPARTRVRLEVQTADVIHSFWLPRLNRKIDLIPGRTNSIVLEADEPGVYRGQCAEFCGLQHANMAFFVYADPAPRFRAWLREQARPRRAPTRAQSRTGEQAFLSEACAGCHTIRGTQADGEAGPDLTHAGSRATLASGTIPNTRAALTDWITDPQHVKPGNRMPALGLPQSEIAALVAYLEGLD